MSILMSKNVNVAAHEYDEPEPERDYGVEARMILQGLTGLLVERRHLEALEDYYSGQLIQLANDLEMLKRKALTS